MIDYEALLLQLLGSLTLCDHMGDVADDVLAVMGRLGIEDAYDDEYDDWKRSIGRTLHDLGVTTLYDSELWCADDDDEDDDDD